MCVWWEGMNEQAKVALEFECDPDGIRNGDEAEFN
jgi:hypothetical protein